MLLVILVLEPISTMPPPFKINLLLALPKLLFARTIPELIVMSPLMVLAPESSNAPPPVSETSPFALMLRPPVPASTEEIVRTSPLPTATVLIAPPPMVIVPPAIVFAPASLIRIDGVATVPVIEAVHAPTPSAPAEKIALLPSVHPIVAAAPAASVLQFVPVSQAPATLPEPAVTPFAS